MKLKVWARELRLPFLTLPVIFVPVTLAMAWTHGALNPFYAVLTLIGATLLHASVNVLNDYFDYRSGIDLATTPTPFSGGSTILPQGLLKPRAVLGAGILLLTIAAGIGIYILYAFAFPPIPLSLLVISIVSVTLYTPKISTWGMREVIVGLNFGPLLAAGVYFVQTQTVTAEPLLIGAVLGILTTGILYINQFPDTDADSSKGRMHLVARMGKKKAAMVFKYMMGAAYALIVAGMIFGITPILKIIALATIPKAWNASRNLDANYTKIMELIPGMANTVMATIFTGILLLVAYIAWGIIVLMVA